MQRGKKRKALFEKSKRKEQSNPSIRLHSIYPFIMPEEKRLSASKLIEKKDRSSSSVSERTKEALKNALRSEVRSSSISPSGKVNGSSGGLHVKAKVKPRVSDERSNISPAKPVGDTLPSVSLSDFVDGPGPSDSADGGGSEVLLNPDANNADFEVPHPTKDRMRDKVRKLLADAMDKDGESVLPEGRVGIEQVANAIEHAMYAHFGETDTKYKTKYRDLNFNLKDPKNVSLRKRVLTRFVTLDKLISMSNQELANDELKQTRKQVQDKMTRDAQPSNRPVATTTQFKCGKCKQRKTTYFQMQTRSADEPLTTFVTCTVCGNRWKF